LYPWALGLLLNLNKINKVNANVNKWSKNFDERPHIGGEAYFLQGGGQGNVTATSIAALQSAAAVTL